ncbi:bifunctional (p)ppGpp synthetase/guanosine-3',5'-bis(diphosphate) 3'-pyrophosphohydrolase [bacterium]|nr:bifunctional (p)ppGpp synthetase/guanosine-3',5'-bis(diphosphate) 3'-pyrophosphohydrolase [bacterium]
MLRIEDITDRICSYIQGPDIPLINRAYIFSAKVHKGQTRASGEPYLTHPLEVAGILTQMKLDEITVASGLLHDTAEDTLTTIEEIKGLFGQEVAFIVDGLSKISQISFESREAEQAENYRKMILAIAKDIRVILIKLADRLHNMRTLYYLDPESKKRIAQETMDIYAPFANRLGMARIKSELEDLSFKYLEPDAYEDIVKKVEETNKIRSKIIEEAIRIVSEELKKFGINSTVYGRPKHIYSTYQKMIRKGIPYDQIFDQMGIRIITKDVKDCYAAVGVIHSLWRHVPGEFDDYIATPKPNMYQSLHTVVIGPSVQPLEFQIRTEEMNRTAEEGIAAHWRYKEKEKLESKYDKKLVWLRQLMEYVQELKDPNEFLQMMKVDLFQDEVFVFTPKGEVKGLPQNATPVDFAYSVHTDVGNHCLGAKVNGKIVPLNYKLKTSDVVEILTSANHKPSRDWLKFVKSPKAIQKIKHWLKLEEMQRSLSLGKEILDKEARNYGINYNKLYHKGMLKQAARIFFYQNIDELIADIGYGKISAKQVIHGILPKEKLKAEKEPSVVQKAVRKIVERSVHGIKIKGADDVLIRFAKCCNPVPGDRICGFITRGKGITVHRADCPNAKSISLGSERQIEVNWDTKNHSPYSVGLIVISEDRPGLLAAITTTISNQKVNIISASVNTTEYQTATSKFVIEITDIDHLTRIINSIRRISGILQVSRIR